MVAFWHSFGRWTERLRSKSSSGRGRLKSCGKYRFLGFTPLPPAKDVDSVHLGQNTGILMALGYLVILSIESLDHTLRNIILFFCFFGLFGWVFFLGGVVIWPQSRKK